MYSETAIRFLPVEQDADLWSAWYESPGLLDVQGVLRLVQNVGQCEIAYCGIFGLEKPFDR